MLYLKKSEKKRQHFNQNEKKKRDVPAPLQQHVIKVKLYSITDTFVKYSTRFFKDDSYTFQNYGERTKNQFLITDEKCFR